MSDATTGQVAASAAEVYEEFFVPALFAEWAARVCDTAMVAQGQSVLDVGCGTGVAARTALERVGPTGSVVGLDANEGMLAVAGRADPTIDWRLGAAESLPFDDASFDAVVSQFALMFFDDPAAAIAEMRRVTRPGGRIAVAVWGPLEGTPGYSAMCELLRRLFGEEAAESLRVPYSMGDGDELVDMFTAAGLDGSVSTLAGTARFASIDAWVHTDIRGWTLADKISDDDYERLLAAATSELQPFVGDDGSVSFAHPAHIATAVVRP